jgi:hypothetical protein
MLRKKAKRGKKKTGNATRASVEKEMAKPRMARSAKIAELNLDTARIREQPSTTMRGTVAKIIQSPRPSEPEKAQIAVDRRTDHRHQDLRIENTLTDEHGDDVSLKRVLTLRLQSQPNQRPQLPELTKTPSRRLPSIKA